MNESSIPEPAAGAESSGTPAEVAARALDRALRAVPLASSTSARWVQAATGDPSTLLEDHCQCELKAASNALAFMHRNPRKEELVQRMERLAREELEHYQLVRRLMARWKIEHRPPRRSPYMRGLAEARRGGGLALLDALLISAVVEARSCERFFALAGAFPTAGGALPGEELAKTYGNLARSESGHAWVFVELARRYHESSLVDEELRRWVLHEARVLDEVPLSPRMHGGNGNA